MQSIGIRCIVLFCRSSDGAAVRVMPLKASAQEQAAAKTFKQEELDQMLAPIALYPDSLLTQILMASTYPLRLCRLTAGQSRTNS